MKRRISRYILTAVTVLVMMFTTFAPYSAAFVGTETKPIVNTFVPLEIEVSDLIIKKTVEHPYGPLYQIPDNIAFDFEVNFGPFYAGFTFNTSAGEIKADENGMITVPVRPNVNFGIEGVDEGTKVTVTELQKENDGFTPKNDVVTQEVTILADTAVTVEFTNIYKPLPATAAGLTVYATKDLIGRDWQKGDWFTFMLEYNDGSGWKELGQKTVKYGQYTGFNTASFTDLVKELRFLTAGSYYFRMTEIAGIEKDMIYDDTVNEFEVVVHDPDMDGRLQIVAVKGTNNTAVTGHSQYRVDMTFSNLYNPPPVIVPADLIVPIKVQKTVKNTGKLSIGPEGFQFELQNVETGEKITRTSDEKGNAVFNLGFSAEDIGKTYRFRLSEVNTKQANVKFDTTVYDLTVTIEKATKTTLRAKITHNRKTTESFTATFVNTYRVGTSQSPDTGDHSNVELYLALAAASAGAIVLLLIFRKKIQNFLD